MRRDVFLIRHASQRKLCPIPSYTLLTAPIPKGVDAGNACFTSASTAQLEIHDAFRQVEGSYDEQPGTPDRTGHRPSSDRHHGDQHNLADLPAWPI